MKVEIKEVEHTIDWTKSQVVVGCGGERFQVVTNKKSPDPDCFCGIDLENGIYHNGWAKIHFKPETKQDLPIKLELTIESEQELCDLWLRTSVLGTKINELAKESSITLKHKAINENSFCQSLEKLVEGLNLHVKK